METGPSTANYSSDGRFIRSVGSQHQQQILDRIVLPAFIFVFLLVRPDPAPSSSVEHLFQLLNRFSQQVKKIFIILS